eukprot:Trichotokara_eunicae@DN2378_c0_g1_i1.p1
MRAAISPRLRIPYYCKILNLGRNPTLTEAKKAYYSMSKQYHPDMNPLPDACNKLLEVQKAFQAAKAAIEQEASGNPRASHRIYDNFKEVKENLAACTAWNNYISRLVVEPC